MMMLMISKGYQQLCYSYSQSSEFGGAEVKERERI
jgi:hypothetical protein